MKGRSYRLAVSRAYPRAMSVPTLSKSAARTLLLDGQGLLSPTSRPASDEAVLREIRRLGFVQLDSISVVERAHHHILFTRLHDYRPATLDRLQRAGHVFEHWTHDASVIPSEWFPHWRHRFGHVAWEKWLRSCMGRDYRAVLDAVIERIRTEGPLQARHFQHQGRRGGPWWDWKPAKAALEYWWRTGRLAVRHRVRFEKVYDLTERVLPHVHALPTPEPEVHTEWACRSAIDRLGVATPREIAAFWNFLKPADAAKWCAAAAGRGEIIPVHVQNGVEKPRLSYALVDWRERLERAAPPPQSIRLLSPFDPIIRDRARCLRLFDFDYRFEAFVPQAKRKYGYYVLPILRADRLIGRLDPRLDRDAGVLHIQRVWWEPGVKPTRKLRAELDAALATYAEFAGASKVVVDS